MCLINNRLNTMILYGDEPYMIEARRKSLEKKITLPELNLLKTDGWSMDVVTFLSTYPVADDNKLAVVNVKDLKELNTDSFQSYIEMPSSYGQLLVIAEKVDKRSVLYKKLSKEKVFVECGKVTDAEQLKAILLREVQSLDGKMTAEAYRLFLQKENYGDEARADISILNLLSDLHRLVAWNPEITVDSVNLLIKDNYAAKTFAVSKLIADGDVPGLRVQAELLKNDAIGNLSALLREYRIAWKSQYFPNSEIGVSFISFKKLATEKLERAIDIIMSALDGIKDGSLPSESVLMYTYLQLVELHKN